MPDEHLAAMIGRRLRDARINAQLTVREAAQAARLPNHSILVRYEQGSARPPLERLAALAATYHTTLAALLVERDDLAPLVATIERADTATLSRLRAALAPLPAPASPPEQSDVPF